MLTERLQLLLTRAQRRRLEAEARRRGISVGALVREALDARGRGLPPEERRRAVDEIRRMHGGRGPSVAALERIVDDEREAAFGRRGRRAAKR